jgi:hypothetical protein
MSPADVEELRTRLRGFGVAVMSTKATAHPLLSTERALFRGAPKGL